jgi:hypothetical protein
MRRFLQLLALLIVLAAGSIWAVTGASRGWTKTSVMVKTLDPVTGIEGISYEKRFLPGVDFLGAALGGATALVGVSLFFRKTNNNQQKQKINTT